MEEEFVLNKGEADLKKDNELFQDSLFGKEHHIKGLTERVVRLDEDSPTEAHSFQSLNILEALNEEVDKLKENLRRARGETDRLKGILCKKDGEIECLQTEIQKKENLIPEIQIQEKIVETVKKCNHIPEIRQLEEKIAKLEGDVMIKDCEAIELTQTIQSLEASISEKDSKIIALHEEIEKLKLDLHNKDNELVQNLKVELEKSRDELLELRNEVVKRDEEIVFLNTELDRHKEDYAPIQGKSKERDPAPEIKELLRIIEILEGNMALRDKEIGRLQEELNRVNVTPIDELKEESGDSNAEMKAKIQELLSVIGILEEDKAHAEGEVKKISKEVDKLHNKLDKKKKKGKDSKHKFKEIKKENEHLTTEVDRLNKLIEEFKERKLEEAKPSSDTEVHSRNEEIRKLTLALTEKDSQINELELRITTLIEQNEGFSNNIITTQKQLETALNDVRERDKRIQELEDTIQTLKNEINKMKSIEDVSANNLHQQLKEKTALLEKAEQDSRLAEEKIDNLMGDLETERLKTRVTLQKLEEELKEARKKASDLEFQNQASRDQLMNASKRKKGSTDIFNVQLLQKDRKKLEGELKKNQAELRKLKQSPQTTNIEELEEMRLKVHKKRQRVKMVSYLVIIAVVVIGMGIMAISGSVLLKST